MMDNEEIYILGYGAVLSSGCRLIFWMTCTRQQGIIS
jgi:hypothetical protein